MVAAATQDNPRYIVYPSQTAYLYKAVVGSKLIFSFSEMFNEPAFSEIDQN
jgi:hypothetical protein